MMSRITLNIRRRMDITPVTYVSGAHDGVPGGEVYQMSQVEMGNGLDGMSRDGWEGQDVTQAVIDISPRARTSEETVGHEAGAMALL